MANILDRYGIKEVADVTFYSLSDAGVPMYPVLYLDTLKVSTIEQTAEEATANGGKGNAPLISWDYGKDINVTLEDALFSAKSMAVMFGNGTVQEYKGAGAAVMKTEVFTATKKSTKSTAKDAAVEVGWSATYTAPDGKTYNKINPKFYADNTSGAGSNVSAFEANTKYFCSYDLAIEGTVIDVSASSFPGTYYVTGDTYARSEASGRDEFFQFIIPKAKVTSENTITLEAEGDPSVFNLNLHVLRPADGVMMKLVKYDLINSTGTASEVSNMYHNHYLVTDNTSNTSTDLPEPTTGTGLTD